VPDFIARLEARPQGERGLFGGVHGQASLTALRLGGAGKMRRAAPEQGLSVQRRMFRPYLRAGFCTKGGFLPEHDGRASLRSTAMGGGVKNKTDVVRKITAFLTWPGGD